jgi:hypothetical protein
MVTVVAVAGWPSHPSWITTFTEAGNSKLVTLILVVPIVTVEVLMVRLFEEE